MCWCILTYIILSFAVVWAVAVSAISAQAWHTVTTLPPPTGGIEFPVLDSVFGVNNTSNGLFKLNLASVKPNATLTINPITAVDAVSTTILLPAPSKPDFTTFDTVAYQQSSQLLSNKTLNQPQLLRPWISGSEGSLFIVANITPGSEMFEPFSNSCDSGGLIRGEIAVPTDPFWEMSVVFTSPFPQRPSSVQLTPASTECADMGPYFVSNVGASSFTIRQNIVTPPAAPPNSILLFYYRVN